MRETIKIINQAIKANETIKPPASLMEGLQLALCVSTEDPLFINRIRFFHPALNSPDTPLKALPFARPISPFGGIDDTGVTWIPQAGSTVALIFQNGNRNAPFYIGTIWNRDRGNPPKFDTAIPEWSLWAGTRKGYLIGKDDETQVFPPWNTWNYSSYDYDTTTDFNLDPGSEKRRSKPHIYGFKSPEKAYLIMNDGDRERNLRWKHTQLSSSRGNTIILKDDHLHPAGQWCNPKSGSPSGNAFPSEFNESTECCLSDQTTVRCDGDPAAGSRFANPFHKRMEEARAYRGPTTPLNPKTNLPQSGIRLQSLSGHHMEFDDSVEQPSGTPSWDREFDFGCTNKFTGKCYWGSATGHLIQMNDEEDTEENRSENNGILIRSACGNFLELNDHSVDKKHGGDKRGFWAGSTSGHTFIMADKDVEQAATPRTNDGIPEPKAKNAYVMLRSGYGIRLYMSDVSSQKETTEQFLQMLVPQSPSQQDVENLTIATTGNQVEDASSTAFNFNDRGPHILHMQAASGGPGTVLLRAGGVMWTASTDHNVEAVGDRNNSGRIANKFIDVTGFIYSKCDDIYYNENKLTVFKSDDLIVLAAGTGCPSPQTEAQTALEDATLTVKQTSATQSVPNQNPCLYPAIVAKDPWVCPWTGFVHFGIGADASGGQKNSMSTNVILSSGS